MLSSHFTYGSWEWENKGRERERNEHAHREVRDAQFRAVEFCAKVKFLLLEITVRMFAKAGHTLGVLLYLGTGTLEREKEGPNGIPFFSTGLKVAISH